MTKASRVALACAASTLVAGIAVAFCPPATRHDPTTTAVVTQLVLIVTIGCGGVVLGAAATPRITAIAIAFLVGLYLFTAATLTLSANEYAPFGAGVDQSFRTAYLTKLAAHWGPVDFAYRGLPWFYPPAYFWVLARAGGVFGVPAWQMLKIGVLAGAALVPMVSLVLWSRLVPWAATIAIVIATLVIQYWYAPYEWLVAVAFVPWWVIVWRLDQPTRRHVIVLSVIGALIIVTFYYYLLVGVLMLIAVVAARHFTRWNHFGPGETRAVARVLAWSTVLSSWYWGPLLWAAIQRGTWDPLQHRFYGLGNVAAPLPFLDFDLVGVVLLGGLVFLVIGARRSGVVMTLALLLAAAYAWYAIGYLGVVVGVPLLTEKVTFLIEWILAIAAALGVVDAVQWLREQPHRAWPAAGVGLGVIAVALAQAAPRNIAFVEEQRAEKYPARLLTEYRRIVGDDSEVVLTDVITLDLYLPNVYLFNVWNANYANPVADFTQRSALIRKLGRERDHAVFRLVLAQNRFDRIERVVFRRGERKYSFDDDDFPNGTKHRVIRFQPEAFIGFSQALTKDLDILTPPEADLSTTSCATLHAADERYHRYLSAAAGARIKACDARGA